jgi:hypothetical protein
MDGKKENEGLLSAFVIAPFMFAFYTTHMHTYHDYK